MMANGKQVRLFLADGTPGGLLTAEIMNWSGHVLAAPRSDIGELLQRGETRRTGVYILFGDDPDAIGNTAAYIGEADDIAHRLRSHARPAEQNGKDFWDRAVVLTSKDSNLTKAHARYLESRLISLATDARRSRLLNGTAPTPTQLPEADVSDMEYFISQLLIVLPVLGISLFRQPRTLAPEKADAQSGDRESPMFHLTVTRHGVDAWAKEIDGEFTVLSGAACRGEWVGTERHAAYTHQSETLIADGSMSKGVDGTWRLTRDVVFSSPSAAGAVVTGRSCNGRTAWVTAEGTTFGAWQSRDLAE